MILDNYNVTQVSITYRYIRRCCMKQFFGFLMVVCCVFTLTADARAEGGTFKIGGGMFFDNNIPGGNLSLDFPIGEGKLALSPFVDVFYKSESKLYDGGLNLLWNFGSGDSGNFYLGAGAGVGYVDIGVGVPGASVSASKTQFAADVVAGFSFGSSESLSFYAQGKWIGVFGGGSSNATVNIAGLGTTTVPVDLELRNFAVQVGLNVPMGR